MTHHNYKLILLLILLLPFNGVISYREFMKKENEKAYIQI